MVYNVYCHAWNNVCGDLFTGGTGDCHSNLLKLNLQPAEPRESAWNRRRQAKALVFLARQARPYLQDLLRSHSTGENDSLPKSHPHKISRAVATQARLVPSSSSTGADDV